MCVAMAVGIIAFMPLPWREVSRSQTNSNALGDRTKLVAPWIVGVAGLWNFAWYGLQNIPSFWGIAALTSGIIMLLSFFLLTPKPHPNSIVESIRGHINKIRLPVYVGLVASFLLYLVTLIQLNLGLPIIA
jgi:hypothetical protein